MLVGIGSILRREIIHEQDDESKLREDHDVLALHGRFLRGINWSGEIIRIIAS